LGAFSFLGGFVALGFGAYFCSLDLDTLGAGCLTSLETFSVLDFLMGAFGGAESSKSALAFSYFCLSCSA